MFVTLFCAMTSCNESSSNDLEKEGLKGDIVSYTDTIWKSDLVRNGDEVLTVEERTFDSNGNIKCYCVKDLGGKILIKIQNEYDGEKLKTKILETNDYKQKEKYEYGKGKVIRTTIVWKQSEQQSFSQEEYYKDGRLDSVSLKRENGELGFSEKYDYVDENGSFQKTVRDSIGRKTQTYYVYKDYQGREIRSYNADEKNTVYASRECVYNEKGFVGNEKVRYISYKHKSTYQYEYDEKGNWTEMTEFVWLDNGQPTVGKIVNRRIFYKK